METGVVNILGNNFTLPINGSEIIELINENIPQLGNGTFAFQKGKNDTSKDLFFRINNGQNDMDEFNEILEWNGDASLKENWWPKVARTPSQVSVEY